VGSEYDRVYLGAPTPRPIQVLTHSPLVCDGRTDVADAAYYSTRSGAGVFDSGTSDWIAGLNSPNPTVRRVVTAVTTRILVAFAVGPAGRAHPARDNATRYAS
jgi:hypothetical protein